MPKSVLLLTLLTSFTVACGNCSDSSTPTPPADPNAKSDKATLVAPAKVRTTKQMGIRGHHKADAGQVGAE